MKVEMNVVNPNFDQAWVLLKMTLEVIIRIKPDPRKGNLTFTHVIPSPRSDEIREVKVSLSPEELSSLGDKEESWRRNGFLLLTDEEIQGLDIEVREGGTFFRLPEIRM